MKITKEQKEILSVYIDKTEEYIEKDDVNGLLREIDWVITEKGLTQDQEWLTPFGKIFQKIYDDIYYQNER